MIISGLCSVLLTVIVIVYTDLDIYAVAGVSSIVTILKNLVFTIPVASKLIDMKWYTFYPQVGQSLLSCTLVIAIGLLVRAIIPVSSWITFFLACGIVGILSLCANMFIVLNKEERNYLIGIIKKKLHIKA